MGVCGTKNYDEHSNLHKPNTITSQEVQQQRMEAFYKSVTDILSILSDDISSSTRDELYQSIIVNTDIDSKRQDPIWRDFIKRRTKRKQTTTDIWLRVVFDIESK